MSSCLYCERDNDYDISLTNCDVLCLDVLTVQDQDTRGETETKTEALTPKTKTKTVTLETKTKTKTPKCLSRDETVSRDTTSLENVHIVLIEPSM
jgi:hypothetical protein